MLALVLVLAAQTSETPAAPAPAPSVDEGAIVDLVESVLAHGKDAVRVAVPPVQDADEARRKAVEIALVRAILDRRREDVVTPAYLRAKLRAQGEAQVRDVSPEALKAFACDHVLLASVVDSGGTATLQLKLLYSESGEVLAQESVGVAAGKQTTTHGASVRTATEELVEQIAFAIEGTGADVRTHRVAVSPLKAEGAAKESRLDQFTQSELLRALKRRGFLVVERAQLAAALDQAALGQVLDEAGAPQIGKALGAQSIVVGSVSDGGNVFVVAVRVISAESGQVIGAGSAQLPRDDVVTMAQVETRTPIEAALRSVVAPGWGQAYNGEDAKALAFGIGGYGGLLTTASLGVAGIVSQAHYNDVGAFEKLPPGERGAAALDARHTTDALYVSTAIAGGVTATVWALGIADAVISSPKY